MMTEALLDTPTSQGKHTYWWRMAYKVGDIVTLNWNKSNIGDYWMPRVFKIRGIDTEMLGTVDWKERGKKNRIGVGGIRPATHWEKLIYTLFGSSEQK